MGAESRYEDWVLLDMLATEWLRPVSPAEKFENIAESVRPAPKAIVVLVFWTYFETKIERLLREPSSRFVPERVLKDLLKRNGTVTAKMRDAYKLLYDTTYYAELEALGYQRVAQLLQEAHQARNDFVHGGHPEAITAALVEKLVAGLEDEHKAWIEAFNARVKSAHQSGAT